MEKFYLKNGEWRLIASTPEGECWICDELCNSVEKDDKGSFIPTSAIYDDGIKEHLQQIVGREIIFTDTK